MAERRVGQRSFADELVAEAAGSNAMLEQVGRLVDWSALEALLSGLRGGAIGAPAYPSLVLLKALLLQQWHGLSDPGLEEALTDRLSFRRFIGLGLSEAVPDHSTLWRFREQLAASGLAGKAFALVTGQIERSGFVLRQGTLIDASLVRSAVNPPPPPDAPLPPDPDGRPASKLVKSERDPDAGWTRTQKNQRVFGYKIHVAMDQGSRIVRRAVLTPATINDSVPADALICGDEKVVYADKAYDQNARRLRLKALGIRDGIMRRANKWHAMGRWAIRRNKVISRRRAPVEPLFALLKRVYGFARARYRGLARNAAALHLALIAINLKRWATASPPTA
jgi:IS5 family transposase